MSQPSEDHGKAALRDSILLAHTSRQRLRAGCVVRQPRLAPEGAAVHGERCLDTCVHHQKSVGRVGAQVQNISRASTKETGSVPGAYTESSSLL